MRAPLLLALLITGLGSPAWAAGIPSGTIVELTMQSQALADNLVGLDATRRLKVYLPPGYDDRRRYPVLYYFHNMNWSARQLFEENQLNQFVDRAIAQGRLGEIIVVAGDFSTPSGINFFGNDRVAGRWIDHIATELVPLVDQRFRTLATPGSRGLTGDFFGGFAALKVAMLHPGKFGAVYALHPVGTGTGLQPGRWRPDWKRVHEARRWEDLRDIPYATVFVAMAQAYLPNPSRPPFYCDFMVEPRNGELLPVPEHIATLYSRFLLDAQLMQRAAALTHLNALKIDWGRYDPVPGHVYANQAFTRKLEEYGVPHFAEEYSGNEWNQLWTPHGRVEMDLLPFFASFLEGAGPRRR
jgi:hypothetical protein